MADFSWNLNTDGSHDAHSPGSGASEAPLTRRQLRERETPAKKSKQGKVAKVKRASRGQKSMASGPQPSTAGRRMPRRRRSFFSKLFSLGAMIGVGALMVSTSLPANAFYQVPEASAATSAHSSDSTAHEQSMSVAATAVEGKAERDTYTVSSLAARLRLQYGNRIYNYSNDINGTIQWPFPIAVPISSGYGPRISPCRGCSSFHEGVDFIPGRGVAIRAIADGVVSHAGLTGGYGYDVVVDHVINGQKVQSIYAHMAAGSIVVKVGDHVKVTQILGQVGSTGESTGPHMHLEIHINGVPVDPFAWLKANAN